MTIPTRLTGPSGIPISALGLGSWNTWDRVDDDTAAATLRAALDAGVTYFDVGIYGNHLDEPDLAATEMRFAAAWGRLGVARDSWTLAAKAWLPDEPADEAPDGAPTFTRQLHALLHRLHTDHADILVLGDLMTPRTDYSAFLDEIGAILGAGDARAWAVNNWATAEIAEITAQARERGIPGPAFAQHKYGLTRRSVPEGEPMRALCERTGVRVQASDVFEGGLLFGPRTAGTSRLVGGDIGGTHARLAAEAGAIRDAAARLGATPAQLAIAVPLLNPHTSNVLVGTRTPQQLRDNLGAFALLERCAPDEIRAAADPFWFDRDLVAGDASWGTRPGDDPATYVVETR